MAEDDSEEEDDERPLTRDEIRLKMLRALRRREAGEAKTASGGAAATGGKGSFSGTARAERKGPAANTGRTPVSGRGRKTPSDEFRRVYCAIVTHTYDRVTGHRT